MPAWTVVIPVKSSPSAKSRLGRGPEVAQAIALDTIAAAVAVDGVRVIVVTADRLIQAEAQDLGAAIVREPSVRGLDAAILQGLEHVEPDHGRAVLLGDLPALSPDVLAVALGRARRYRRAFVPDADGTGTTLVTARPGTAFQHSFGPGSAGRHRQMGMTALRLPVTSSLRRDVDLEQHLGPDMGPRTRRALTAD
ncbi:MAG: 2-phospho-L-lactate guanylyltransferase [Pseudolysinimonas sp.]